MHDGPDEPWTVERLASAVGLSRSGFAARFRATVGEPPLEYLGGWRMTKAAQLLRESDDSTRAVAARVGYQSDAAFNRAFKRWEGKGLGVYCCVYFFLVVLAGCGRRIEGVDLGDQM